MVRLRVSISIVCLFLALGQPAMGESLSARSVVLNHPVTFLSPGGGQIPVSPGVYQLAPESDSLLQLIPSRGPGIIVVVATRFSHRMAVPEPLALTRAEGEIVRVALLFPDGHGLEAVGTTTRVGTRDVSDPTIVTLERPAHFSGPDGSDAIAEPGAYRIEASSPTQLELIPVKGDKATVTVQAIETSHQELLSLPVAVLAPEEGAALHVLLLLPQGAALDAIGSYNAVRTRGPVEPLNSGRITAVLKTATPAGPSSPASGPPPASAPPQTRNKVVLSPEAGPSGIVVQVSACGLQGSAGASPRVRVSGLGAPDQELTPAPCPNGGYGFGAGTNLPPVAMKVQSALGGNSVAVDLLSPNSPTPIERSVGFFSVKPSIAVGKITSLQVRTDFLAGFFDQCPVHSHVIVTLDSQGDVKFGIAGKSDMAEAMTQVLQDAWGRDRPIRVSYAHNDFLSCHPANPIIGVEAFR